MYKRKLLYFGVATAFILLLALICTAVSAHLTRENLKQSSIAQTLLAEHQQLSSISYRLFKQLTDQMIFGQNANQANVRNKQVLIEQTLANIQRLELQQREALGYELTHGTVEDTKELATLIQSIVDEFALVFANGGREPLAEQEALRVLLENTIDENFREVINAAVVRQGRVVAAINAKIATLNTAMVWFTVGLGMLSVPLIMYGCYWLFHQLYNPLSLITSATQLIASGNYRQPIAEKLDDEFNELALSINQLASRLQEHENKESQSRRELEYEVEQRTKELTTANQQLTQIDSRRRRFIADVSHELRTPLTIIRGEAQVTLRLKSASEADYKETLQSILEQSVALSHLVDDLLLLTRAEMNQLHIELKPCNLMSVLTSEVVKWQRLHPDRLIKLTTEDAMRAMQSRIDKPRMHQVLSILLDNATKYSEKGQPIEVTLSQTSSDIQISIRDFGEGISAAEIENVFERFVRFSKHATGLGLGLPIAKAIVEGHGGRIFVHSVQGEGSVFSVTLPKVPLSSEDDK